MESALMMDTYSQCWKNLDCRKTNCSVYGKSEPECWTVPTDCYSKTEGKVSFKFLKCFQCEIFDNNATDETKMLARAILDFQALSESPIQ
jgi:hypothetical protein